MIELLKKLIDASKETVKSSAKPTQVWHADDTRDCGAYKVVQWTAAKRTMIIAPGINVTCGLLGENPVVGYGDISILQNIAG